MNKIGIGEIIKEFGYWILFSVVIALAQLWLIPWAYFLANKPWTWVGLVGNGSLLFFATTITSKTSGEYFKRVKGRHEIATLVCVAVTFIIISISVFAYAVVMASRVGALTNITLSPARIATTSDLLAISGVIFSLAYTIYIRIYGE